MSVCGLPLNHPIVEIELEEEVEAMECPRDNAIEAIGVDVEECKLERRPSSLGRLANDVTMAEVGTGDDGEMGVEGEVAW